MKDDQADPTPGASPHRGRYFALPRVRELRPDSVQPPADAEAEAEDRAPPSFPGEEEPRSKDDAATEASRPTERRDTFQRRWEQVQARFVDQAARDPDVTGNR